MVEVPADFAMRVVAAAAPQRPVLRRSNLGPRVALLCGCLLWFAVLLAAPVLSSGSSVGKAMETLLCLELAVLAGVAGFQYRLLRWAW